ncbi:Small-conductance mechanosensitive channel [Suttonella ornithocola]|uniref:Small-conductance mechanosensitive channel n=1 Tax=Suttonella ornithocola TaxID=279832 RepID=A0A380MSC6_9GAMM|nr:Small-conductance mechanosensitive channel [Suttonella ornithocola]
MTENVYRREKLKKIFLLVGLSIFGIPLLFAQTVLPAEEATPEEPPQAVSVTAVAADDDIATRIREILKATDWYKNVKVSVRDGVVFLDGIAGSDEQKQWARNLAAKTQDVVAVVNRLQVDASPDWSFTPAFNEMKRLLAKFVRSLPLIVLALVIIPLAWMLAKTIYRLSQRFFNRRLRSALLADIVAKVVALPAILVALYVVLQVAGLTGIALSLLGGAGVVGIVLGFAFQDIAENFLASLLLSLRHPFSAGDTIEVAGQTGIVQSMNTRSTVLLSPEGNHIQIPNSMVFKSIIYNYSTAPARRNILSVGIGYDASISTAQQLIMSVLQAHEAVTKEPKPLVLVDELAAATVNLKIYSAII